MANADFAILIAAGNFGLTIETGFAALKPAVILVRTGEIRISRAVFDAVRPSVGWVGLQNLVVEGNFCYRGGHEFIVYDDDLEVLREH
jgi:hypothetical protein